MDDARFPGLFDTARRRLSALRADDSPRWGTMSARQMVCHLADSLEMAIGARPVRRRSGTIKALVTRLVGLHTPVPFPRRFPAPKELRQGAGGTPPGDFDEDVARLSELMDRFALAAPELKGREHPLFGRLTAREWCRWAEKHFDHHLRQFGV